MTTVSAMAEAAALVESRFPGPGRQAEMLRNAYVGCGLVVSVLVTPQGEACSKLRPAIQLIENHGVADDRHAGATATVDGRDDVLRFFMGTPKGTRKANLRQVTVVSQEEGVQAAAAMELPGGAMPPGVQAENMVLLGIPRLSELPPRTRLMFLSPTGEPRSASLCITAPNAPCGHPHANIVAYFGGEFRPAMTYAQATKNQRGLTAVVETGSALSGTEGWIYSGDIVTVWKHN